MIDLAGSDATNKRVLKRLKRRKAADARFRVFGLSAVGFALSALAVLLLSIGYQAFSATTYHVVEFDMSDMPLPTESPPDANVSKTLEAVFRAARDDLGAMFPESGSEAVLRMEMSAMITRLAALPTALKIARDPGHVADLRQVRMPLSDDLDLFLKGSGGHATLSRAGTVRSRIDESGMVVLAGQGAFRPLLANASAAGVSFGDDPAAGSALVTAGRSTIRLISATPDDARGELLTGDAADFDGAAPVVRLVEVPRALRAISDHQIAWTLALKTDGRIERVLHWSLLTHTDSTQPELAGTLAAIVGSFLTLMVTASVAIPVGIFASIYLEEFAPKNRLTSLIEVNINNLAAVPSIVFGLLGAAVFLGVFGLPRSAPIVGGLVLSLMILPVVIIASRAALKSVPPSVRSGAMAIGASEMQTVFHHVLPLAAPGILTGAILGMARALGETAPLLLIGMVAFVANVPNSSTDEATALPVLIYLWATQAERAWEPMTAAAIMILLLFLISMNVVVVYLRRRFERKW